MRRGLASLAVLAALTLVTGCFGGKKTEETSRHQFALPHLAGLTLPARVEGRSVAAATENGFVPAFWPGVNLGSTIPGHQPGEVAATRRDYDRWLSGIGDLGARVSRIYMILRPSFYDALAAYNGAHADRSLYFIQGVWVPGEAELDSSGNAYTPSVTHGFQSRSMMPSPSSTERPSFPSGRATRAARTARMSRAGSCRTRSASSGTRMRCARRTA